MTLRRRQSSRSSNTAVKALDLGSGSRLDREPKMANATEWPSPSPTPIVGERHTFEHFLSHAKPGQVFVYAMRHIGRQGPYERHYRPGRASKRSLRQRFSGAISTTHK